MSERGEKDPLFLDDESIKDILEKASKSLLFTPSEGVVEEAIKLIKAMKPDLIRLSKLPLEKIEPFKSHDCLTLKEIDDFYKKQVEEEEKVFISPHTIN